MSARTRRALELALLAAALAAIGVAGERALTDRLRLRADGENLVMAWNLAHHGVMSRVEGHGGAPRPTSRREPLYPALLAVYLATSSDPSVHDLGCLAQREAPCRPILLGLKRVNLGLLLALCVASFWAARAVLGRGPLAFAAFALIATNGVFWALLTDVRTELAAALALLVASTFLHRLALGSRRHRDVVGAGVAFGLLILVKAIFLYVVPAVLGLAACLALRPAQRSAAARLGAAMLVALAVAGVWMTRNAVHGAGFRVAEDRAVLAIRAEYDTMSWREWSASWLYFARDLAPARRALDRWFSPEDWKRLPREAPDGFYLLAKRNLGAAAARAGPGPKGGSAKPAALEAAAREVILEHLPMHLALVGPLSVQAALVYERWWTWWPVSALQAWLGYAFVPALLVAAALLVAQRRPERLAFLLPAVGSFALHVGATHAIARYSWPLLPVATIALAMLPTLAFGRGRAQPLSP